MMPTTMPTPTVSATPCDSPTSISHAVSRCPSVAPEKAPDEHADQRDADLHGGEEFAGVGGQRQRAARAADALSRRGRQAAPAATRRWRVPTWTSRPLMTIRTVTIPSSRELTLGFGAAFRRPEIGFLRRLRRAVREFVDCNADFANYTIKTVCCVDVERAWLG